MPVNTVSSGDTKGLGAGGSSGTDDSEADLLRLHQQYREKLQKLRAESALRAHRRSSDTVKTRDRFLATFGAELEGSGSSLSLVALEEHWKTVGVVVGDDEEDDNEYVLPYTRGTAAHISHGERDGNGSESQNQAHTGGAIFTLPDGVSRSDNHLIDSNVSGGVPIALETFRFKRHSPSINYRYLEATRYPYLNGFLKANAKYVGEQRSGRERYRITVEFQLVDWQNLVVTGFLHITGLTEDHPEITTCFTGEIINNPFYDGNAELDYNDETISNSASSLSSPYFSPMNKSYSFLTENKSWGSTPRNDLEHWRRLTNCHHQVSDSHFKKELAEIIKGNQKQGMIYMRWKEEFLLPDSRVKSIRGASFEGFYYIALNIGSGEGAPANKSHSDYSTTGVMKQFVDLPGTITGLYYHKASEKFQSLFLEYVEDYGRSGTFDFA